MSGFGTLRAGDFAFAFGVIQQRLKVHVAEMQQLADHLDAMQQDAAARQVRDIAGKLLRMPDDAQCRASDRRHAVIG